MPSRIAGRLLTGRLAFLAGGLLDFLVAIRLLLVYAWTTTIRPRWAAAFRSRASGATHSQPD